MARITLWRTFLKDIAIMYVAMNRVRIEKWISKFKTQYGKELK
jgi:hypothetical protein